MKTSDAATIRDMAAGLHSKVMLAGMALLCMRFIMAYLAVSLVLYLIKRQPLFNLTYARKRIVNPNIHDRKFALFPCGTGHGRFT